MATLILSAAGAALGAKVGGAVLGLSGMVIGRAIGATLGRVIDQRLLGRGASAVETGRIDRLRVTGAGEGVALPRVWGRMRLAGHVIWASDFTEIPGTVRRSRFKGAPRQTTAPRYTVSLAVALCEGEISGVGRIWAEGSEVNRSDLQIRVYRGTLDQQPDPVIAAIEGLETTPAYRGTAYVVIEDMDLAPWGNRVPSLSFEVIRAADAPGETTLQEAVRAVAWMPGSGEYALATEPVRLPEGLALPGFAGGASGPVNLNSPSGETDFVASLAALQAELPQVQSGLLIVSWFGSDLRMAECRIEPKVEYSERDSADQPWRVSSRGRADAPELARLDAGPVYGGTPSDTSVVQSIQALAAAGQRVVFYPFILMEQLAGNGLPDPYGGEEQPPLPWRGRITLSAAPGRPGSPDGTAAAAQECAAFFGTAQPADFSVAPGSVTYSGPDEWSYRRFILHYAALCAAAGGVDAFCIGSEMVQLTRIRGPGDTFPAVQQLVQLVQDVRAILGPDVKLTYAADWSEYFGFNDGDGGRYFHLDPLWAHPEIDVIGIDNYIPLSDWRDGEGHLDGRDWRLIYDLDHLKSNIAGGEGFDWFYADESDRAAQRRTPITDGGGQEPWVFRYKDMRAWWENLHYDRPAGVRAPEPTAWEPRSKPIWFTEFGCAAINKGTNQPNKFLDPKSSESAIPYFSTGRRDDLIQMQYIRAMAEYWTDPAHNPQSDVYAGQMVDWSRAHVWAWDARPWPWFPANGDLWADGENWTRGHWVTGRAANQPLSAVVAEICALAGLEGVDVRGLHGVVRGYAVASTDSARAALQPLMLAHGIEAVERDGTLVFRLRDGLAMRDLDPGNLVAQQGGALEVSRAAQAETAGRVRLTHIDAEGVFETRSVEAVIPDEPTTDVATSELALTLTPSEARVAVRRWLAEARIARDVVRFALPPSVDLGPGDVVRLPTPDGMRSWRIDRVDLSGAREIEAVRVEPGPYVGADDDDEILTPRTHRGAGTVAAVFLDLPLMRGDEVPQAPHLAVQAAPWLGSVAVYQGPVTEGTATGAPLGLSLVLDQAAVIGVTESALPRRRAGLWDTGPGLTVRMAAGTELVSRSRAEVLEGANLLALGTGTEWELLQFAQADLIDPGLWQVSDLLRGQFGTEPFRADTWPSGALAVLVTPALVQVDLPVSLRGVARRWRIGAADLAVDDPAFVERIETFRGVGLRPYAPVHLTARRAAAGGALHTAWIRRTRTGGDGWDSYEVPLGEEVERYLVRVTVAGETRRELEVAGPEWDYPPALQAADGVAGPFAVQVAQISGLWGPGPFAQCDVAG